MLIALGRFAHAHLLVLFVLISAQQVIFLFGVHLCAARLSEKLKQPAYLLLRWAFARQMFKVPIFGAKFKLSRFVEQFYSKNAYTVNYGRYGKITFQSFGKVWTFCGVFTFLENNFEFFL